MKWRNREARKGILSSGARHWQYSDVRERICLEEAVQREKLPREGGREQGSPVRREGARQSSEARVSEA